MEVFMASLADEEENTRKLTNRQKTFARLIVEGVYSNAECAAWKPCAKALSSGVLYLFPADQGPDAGFGRVSEAL
jgi:hypothetical protein